MVSLCGRFLSSDKTTKRNQTTQPENNIMKRILVSLALLASAVLLQAQEGAPPAPPAAPPAPPASGPGGPPGGPGGARRMLPPLMVALDTNKDGELTADEIAAAAVSLKTLDKNNDGNLTREELFGAAPPRGEGQGRGQGQGGGQGGGQGRPPREGGPQGPPPGPR